MGIKPRKKRPLFLPGIIAGILVFLWLLRFVHWQPGEGAWVRQFQKNKAAFEELRMMVSTNPPVTPAEAIRQGVATWSVQDYERYRKLLRQTGVIRVAQTGNEYRFVAVEPNRGKTGLSMAVAWRETAPEQLVSRLKDFRKTTSQPEQVYRALEGNWYLWT